MKIDYQDRIDVGIVLYLCMTSYGYGVMLNSEGQRVE